MYVCLCKGITDSQIRAAVADGADSLAAVRETLGVASRCGQCRVMTREIVREARLASGEPAPLFHLPRARHARGI